MRNQRLAAAWSAARGRFAGAAPRLARVAAVANERISLSAFAAALSGPSAIAVVKRRYGARVSYSRNVPARPLQRVRTQAGRRTRSGRCTRPTRSNHRARACARTITLSGSFTSTGRVGAHGSRFTGRLGGHALAPGAYQLLAVPIVNGVAGRAGVAAFRIVR
jgi:hypothetical protein